MSNIKEQLKEQLKEQYNIRKLIDKLIQKNHIIKDSITHIVEKCDDEKYVVFFLNKMFDIQLNVIEQNYKYNKIIYPFDIDD